MLDPNNHSNRRAGAAFSLVFALLSLASACSSGKRESTGVLVEALSGVITISGEINDANGLPLPGAIVTLAGTSESVQTDANGKYAFAGLANGSYSVRPTLKNCSFVPDVVNLNGLTASAIQNFNGSGTGCGGVATVNSGALTGPITIAGRVSDTLGNGIVGVKISLGGNAQALRFTDVTGGYAFNVSSGSYSLSTSGACTVTPANVALNNVVANVVQDFSATTAGCVVSTTNNAISTGQVITLKQAGTVLGQTFVTLDAWPNAAAALAGLAAIAVRTPGSVPRTLTIAGFPAIELQSTVIVAPGTLEPTIPGGANGPAGGSFVALTTAIAVGATVVEFNGELPSPASPSAIATFVDAGRDFTASTLTSLHGPPPATVPTAPAVPPATPPQIPSPMVPGTTSATIGEIEVAAAESSNNVVYASNGTAAGTHHGQVMFSTNLGATINVSTFKLTAAGQKLAFVGDPTIAVGAPNASGTQKFYYAELFASTASGPFTGFRVISVQSTDGTGSTFQQLSDNFALDCSVAANNCLLPDQPHIAADPRTQTSAGGDQLYMAWRHFPPSGSSGFAVGLSCSNDSGANWSTPDLSTFGGGSFDFPKLAVAPDGSVYVGVAIGTGTGSESFSIQKFSSCAKGFVKQLPAVTSVKSGVKEAPVLAGLDRQPTGVFMLAPDDSDTTGNRLFVTYTDANTGAGNDDIKVTESTNGGSTWGTPAAVNSVAQGDRFFPWVCASKGIAYVTWYDRRNATASQPDLTSYFFASLTDPGNTGTPTIRSDFSITGPPSFDDRQCFSGFNPDQALNGGAAIRDPKEETGCGVDLPAAPGAQVNAGVCTTNGVTAINQNAPGSLDLCDFRENNCVAPEDTSPNEACAVADGTPKYGDYNGAACAHGQLFAAWASSQVPQGVLCKQSGAACVATSDCCNGVPCVSGVCQPPGIGSGGSCIGNGSACTEGPNEKNTCCSLNCLAGTCEPGLNVYTSSNLIGTEIQCTTVAIPANTPPLTFSDQFVVDTGLAPYSAIGATYGVPACPAQLVLDVDLTGMALAGQNFSVFGGWSEAISSAATCPTLAAQTIVFARPHGATTFQIWDEVSSLGIVQGGLCNPTSTHSNAADQNAGGTLVPAGMFDELRIAVRATQSGTQAPVIVTGDILP